MHLAGVATSDPYSLQRFIDGQDGIFETALVELSAGSKKCHWMWFIFPQLAELGQSRASIYFGIGTAGEASAYLAHPLLGPRLNQSVNALLPWAGKRSAQEIFGAINSIKLRSNLTLFDQIEPHSLFDQALLNFFGGCRDELTLALLRRQG